MVEQSTIQSATGTDADDQSITNRAYVEIRAALVSCRLKPGARLKIAQLQRELGVSQAAAREGLSRLAAEGLVTIERNSGFRATPVSAQGYRVASRVLGQVAEDAISMDSYVQHREKFHRTLFSKCDNQWLLWSWSLLYTQQLRYRQTFRELARFERGLHEDYSRFLEAVIERDTERAVRLWTENHERVAGFIESSLMTEPRGEA